MDWINEILNEILTQTGSNIFWCLLTVLYNQASLIRGLEDAVDKLRRTHKRIQCLLIDAESIDIEQETVRDWISEMKTFAFDAENHIDEFRTLIDVIEHAKKAPSRKRKRPVPFLGGINTLVKRYRIATDITKKESRLDEIYKSRNLRLEPSDGRQRRSDDSNEMDSVPAVATFDESRIVGRSKEFKSVVDALKVDPTSNLRAVVIYGLAGIGKTTLAQLVFKHFSKSDREAGSTNPMKFVSCDNGYFEKMIWVSLTKVYNVVMATKEIIKEITGKNYGCKSFNHLQDHLKELVKGKKFLLVLDNFCPTESTFWEKLCLPLLEGAKGSRVLITAQNDGVSRGMIDPYLERLPGLQKDDCWKLFSAIVFPQANGDVDQKLKDIGESIAEIFQGSPLATIYFSKLLKPEVNVDNWKTICDKMLENNSSCPILRSFMKSYHQLSYEAKQCFAFCSIFPDNYEFDKDELVRMWTAQGWVRRMPEAEGSVFLNNLRSMSFVERSTESCSSKITCKYTMPSLIRRLACSFSKNELLVMEDNELNPPSGQFRYASLFHTKDQILFEKLYDQVSLRVLKLFNKSEAGVGRIPKDLFNKLKYLWLLDLSNSDIEELPDSVGKLVHLRYLGLARTNVKELPESVENLYNLQTLDLKFCYNLSSLPLGTSNLVNLRHLILHLDWERINDLIPMPTGINYLTSLKTLSRFTVTKEDGCNLKELKDLNLHGEICICKLENITNASDAEEANLRAKEHIDKLMLRWSGETSSVQQSANTWKEVADKLQPHEYLKCLWILNYPGSEFPDWLANTSFSRMETVRLSCSEECESLPPLGLLPKLNHLHIEGMKKLRNLGNMEGFPSLETLTIKNMPVLESLPPLGLLPKLKHLHIEGMEKLRNLENMKGFTSLETLTIENMPVLETFCEFEDGEFPMLRKILISLCPNLPDRLDVPQRIKFSRTPSTDNGNGNDRS